MKGQGSQVEITDIASSAIHTLDKQEETIMPAQSQQSQSSPKGNYHIVFQKKRSNDGGEEPAVLTKQ